MRLAVNNESMSTTHLLPETIQTTGAVAKSLGVESWKLLRVLKLKPELEPAGRCGILRAWGPAEVERLRVALVEAGYLDEEKAP